MLRSHAQAQGQERKETGNLWAESEYVFTERPGGPLSPNTDYHVRKGLLRDAGVRDARLHDARHTSATALLLLGVPDVAMDAIRGWEPGGAASTRGPGTCT